MNPELKNRIYNYEVEPPATAWTKITAELDESCLSNKFPSKIFNASVNPPETAWISIAEQLENLHLSNQFPSVLYELEATPPVSAWEKIASSLDEPVIKTFKPKRRLSPVLSYAVAAALLGIIAFGGLKLLDRNNNYIPVEDVAGNTSPQQQTPITTDGLASEQVTPTTDEEEAAREDAALEASKQTYASLDRSDVKRMQKISEDFFSEPASTIEASANFNPEATYQNLECSDVNAPVFASGNSSIDMASRYALLMTPDGKYIRISRKLGDLVCCVSGELQDEQCVDQLKKWREKIANSPITPAPGNFMDILDLLQSLRDLPEGK